MITIPIYEYKCSDCGYEFEEIKKIRDKSESDCPQCGKISKKLISRSSFVLKGSGFYVNDYGKNKKEKSKEE